MKTRPLIIIPSRDPSPWLRAESYTPEPHHFSLRELLLGIGDALGEWIATPQFQSGMMFAVALMIGVWLAVGHS